VQEIQGMEDRTIVLQELFKYEPKLDNQRQVRRRVPAHGSAAQVPREAQVHGIELPAAVFRPDGAGPSRRRTPREEAMIELVAALVVGAGLAIVVVALLGRARARQDELLRYLELPFAEEDVDREELVERVGLLPRPRRPSMRY
jgi:hypothetical protein